jgi:hypothetical protein
MLRSVSPRRLRLLCLPAGYSLLRQHIGTANQDMDPVVVRLSMRPRRTAPHRVGSYFHARMHRVSQSHRSPPWRTLLLQRSFSSLISVNSLERM